MIMVRYVKNVVTFAILGILALSIFYSSSSYALLVNTNQIAENAITSPKIKDAEIKTNDLANGSLTNSKIANNTITSDKIKDGTILKQDIKPGEIIGQQGPPGPAGVISNDSVTSATIKNGQVRTEDLANDSITSDKIKDGTITAKDIVPGSVLAGEVSDNSITSAKIKDGEVTTADLANNSITAEKTNFLTWHVVLPTSLTAGLCNSLPGFCDPAMQAISNNNPGWIPGSNRTDFQIICKIINETGFSHLPSLPPSFKPARSELNRYSIISISLIDSTTVSSPSSPINAGNNPANCGVYDTFKSDHAMPVGQKLLGFRVHCDSPPSSTAVLKFVIFNPPSSFSPALFH
jgi:hypothetical protein